MQSVHRVRELWMKQRVAVSNQIRGMLTEFGEVMPVGIKKLKEDVALWQARATPELAVLKEVIEQLVSALRQLEERISALEVTIRVLHKGNAASRLMESIPGVGLLRATATVASFGQCESFESARKFAARLGITKRSNRYVRKLLIHGARAVLKARMNKKAYTEDWAVKLAKRRGQYLSLPGRQVALPEWCEMHDQWPVLHINSVGGSVTTCAPSRFLSGHNRHNRG